MIQTPTYSSDRELFAFLVANKSQLVAQKKFEMKRADAVSFATYSLNEKGETSKAADNVQRLLSLDEIDVRVIINTTRLLDGHDDVHIDGLWKKSLQEQRTIYHLQEHEMTFDHVISDEVKAATKRMTWKELGFDYPGETEALVFDSKIRKSRNPFMFEQYAKGYVREHSVGMQYVKIFLCVNNADYKDEKSAWDQYIDFVANREDAEDKGYFWAVTEAKVKEGSAVLAGSNWATPTQFVTSSEPDESTRGKIEPLQALDRVSLFEKLSKI